MSDELAGFWHNLNGFLTEGARYYREENIRREHFATTPTQKEMKARFGVDPRSAEVLESDQITSWTRKSVLRVVRLLAEDHGVAIMGPGGASGAKWIPFRLGDTVEQVPADAWLAFPKGTLANTPLLVQLAETSGGQKLSIAYDKSEPDAALLASEAVQAIHARAKGVDNPYRNRTVLAARGGEFVVLPDFTDTPDDIILDDDAWNAVANIERFIDKLPYLMKHGLSQNRGLLMAGPPGTGKTALTRIIAAKFAGKATVVLAENGIAQHQLATLYKAVADLSPAIVELEDLDLMVGSRQGGSAAALRELLTTLDGLMTTHHGVVTVASTNDSSAIDAAAKRAARFDEHITVPCPDLAGRQRILDVYLQRLGVASVATNKVARAVGSGRSGADLRLLINEAALVDDLTTEGLIKVAAKIFPKPKPKAKPARGANSGGGISLAS